MTQVVHVVLVRWIDRSETDAMSRRASALVDAHLPAIPDILEVARGSSVSTEGLENGYDWALIVRFASAEGVGRYLPHPEHLVVADFLGDAGDAVTVFDVAALAAGTTRP